MYKPILLFTFILITFSSFSQTDSNPIPQTDTIYTNSEKISCSIKEITPEAIKYSYIGEDLIISMYKNSVQKIIFKNGRVQTFSESISLKLVKSVDDFENVAISMVESEVKGLFKLGYVSSKAKGVTIYSNQEKVKDRAFDKLKIEAAMQGANIVYMVNQRTEGNKVGTAYQAGSTAETNLTGIAYSNTLPNFNEFKSLLSDSNIYIAVLEASLRNNAFDVYKTDLNSSFKIEDIINESGLIYLVGSLDSQPNLNKFRVVSFTKNSFNLFYEHRNKVYNVLVLIK